MKIGKYANLIKRRGYGVWINTTESGTFLATSASIYRADGLPGASDVEQAAAILDIDKKKQEKMVLRIEYETRSNDILGYDFTDGVTDAEISAEKMRMAAVLDGKHFEALLCKDGEILFFDEALLLPLSDVLKDELSYITYTVRRHRKGNLPYIVVKNGFITIAAIMPVKVLSDDYIQELQDFQLMCIDQLNREKAIEQRKNNISEAENGRQASIDDYPEDTSKDETESRAGQDDWEYDEKEDADGVDDA